MNVNLIGDRVSHCTKPSLLMFIKLSGMTRDEHHRKFPSSTFRTKKESSAVSMTQI